MPTATTRAAARAQLLHHFEATLRALPAEVGLALRHPDLPKAVFHSGVDLSWDGNDPDNPLRFLDIRYWVVGAAPAESDRYFDLVLRAWAEQGWSADEEPDAVPRLGYTRTPDGFGFSLTQSLSGYLSLAGTTPPFELDSDAGEPLPALIEHPPAP
ncbi:hypothetical protein [Nocardia seriolae]|uniref:hypothetical protein n=1 Tax=Nocardia seriolae TaxID=37332 RepID=UPI00051A8795|nr:hypothetical protein [Nocardia seriolae]MTJ60964.1 hypothetical protein [Nocardia seriolae]MTJ71521.1 hypothetical protein [Nocardia seriolae]MTJ90902.1 hypothetical protein [Nocardia seriolae]MTK38943.1 hypothetical protein [Nocardia seriolae]MTK51477.1 hypothetical protein [Nocardia seriolae]